MRWWIFLLVTVGAWAVGHLGVSSLGFRSGDPIPPLATADGADQSPSLAWSAPPAGAKSLAIVCMDPDAPSGAFCHWIAYNLPARLRSLPAGVPREEVPAILQGGRQGTNDFGKPGYDGPAPPPGAVHHYHFTVMALNASLPPLHSHAEFEHAVSGHVLAQGELIGTYKR
ncbi:MAG TPA: YbhB/YbcL family Raf kinase inhibitor-like protein [Candidatus Xenobia bacterium]|jgi:hypothetical protein